MTGVLKFSPLVRAIAVIGAVAALAGGATFAALQSQATLTDNQFSTATADLKIWDGDSYEITTTGFDFTNVVPGTETAPKTFWLKNTGGIPLDVTLLANSDYSYTGVVDDSKVEFRIVNLTTNSAVDTVTLEEITDGTAELLVDGQLSGNEENQFQVKLYIDPSAVTGTSATLSNLDWTFTGTQPSI